MQNQHSTGNDLNLKYFDYTFNIFDNIRDKYDENRRNRRAGPADGAGENIKNNH